MDNEFLNSYVEVLNQNFDSVLKQNLMFQTQLKIVEKTKIQNDELNKTIEEKNLIIKNLENTITQFQSDINTKQTSDQKNYDSILNEKNRIQLSLNDYMKTNEFLKNSLESYKESLLNAENEIKNLKLQIPKNEEQKINIQLKNNVISSKSNVEKPINKQKLQSGGIF